MDRTQNVRTFQTPKQASRPLRDQTASSGVRFASKDAVKEASCWAIARYAKTFKRLAE
jgi:hypothetical protein